MKNRNQQGFTLIEILLVLAIIAALGVAAFIIYPRVQAGRQATNNTSILNSAAAQINSVFPSARYGNLTDIVACNADVFPDNFKIAPACAAGNLINEWQGVVAVHGADVTGATNATVNARYYTITYPNVPSKVCTKLAPALAANFGIVGIGADETSALGAGKIVDTYNAVATDDAVDEATMTAACNAAAAVTISMVGK